MRWLPQLMWAFQGVGSFADGLRGRVSRKRPRQLHGAARIQESGALRQVVVTGPVLRRVLQNRLDEIRRQRRVGLEHQRDRAGHDGRRHARAAQAQIRLRDGVHRSPDARRRVRGEQQARTVAEGLNPDPGGHEIRFCHAIDVTRAPRAERRDFVVGASGGAFVGRRADREHPRCIARRGDPAVLCLVLRIAAEVARGGDDDDPGFDRALRGDRQRIRVVGLVHAGRHREIDDADVELGAVLHGVVERRDDVADVAEAIGVEHLEHDEAGTGSDPAPGAIRVVSAAGNDARRRACHARSRRRAAAEHRRSPRSARLGRSRDRRARRPPRNR